MRAYRELYLEDAMSVLGAALETAVMLFEVPPGRFWRLFLASRQSRAFAKGDPFTLSGKSGWELAAEILDEAGVKYVSRRPDGFRAHTPEYWLGWALAQDQWYRAFTFPEIEVFAPAEEVLHLYSPYHEMDIRHLIDELDRRYRLKHPYTCLEELRRSLKMTRDQLAEAAQVSSRLIEQYEQRRRDINSARAESVLSLAAALGCEGRDLIERVPADSPR